MNQLTAETAHGSQLAGVLFQRSGDGLLLVDGLTGQIHDANPAAQRVTQFSRTELLEMSLRSLLRHQQPWHDWTLATLGDAAEVHEGFLLRTRGNDSWVPVGLEMTAIPPEGRASLLIRLTDARPDLALQRRAQKAEAELQRVLGNASECHWSARIVSGTWAYHFLSPAAQRLTGRPAGVFLASPAAWADAVAPADRPAWRTFRDRLVTGQPGTLEYRFDHADGRQVRVRETVLVAPGEDGLMLYGVVGELIERPAGEDAPSMGTVDRLLGAVSHDFNNLIAGILGNVTLAGFDASPANTADSLGRIESIAGRAADLCRRLSTCAGQIPRTGSTPDPASVIGRVVAESKTDHPDVEIDLSAEPELAALGVDPATLALAIKELLRNAVLAGASRVAVRVGSMPPATPLPQVFCRPRTGPPAGGVHLQVEDDGPGIPQAAIGRLGEPFFTTRPGRPGLGLATVAGIARACQGVFRLFSLSEAGTLAVLSFPPARPSTPGPQTVGAAGTPQSPLVLLVDDEQAIVDVASRLLISGGCRVITARSGTEAIEQYRRHASEIRLVILDLNLPRLGGDKVATQLRAQDPALPIALMSGHHGLEHRPDVAGLRLAGCLQKPFRFPELLALVERILGPPSKR